MAKSIEERFKKLDEVSHVLLRPGRYIGSVKPHTDDEWVPNEETKRMEKQEVTYNPGFQKLFDEVISNSADFSKREDGKHLDTIKIEVDKETGIISVFDNGGIPVVKHKEHNQWLPEMIFELRAGSNFNDDEDQSTGTGQNGEGAALTNIFSTEFMVETCDGKNQFKMVFADNSQTRNTPIIKPAKGTKGFTRITYTPDYEKLGTSLDDGNYKMLYARVVEVAATNTHLKVYWNGDRIPTRTFKDYIEMFAGDEYAYDENEYFKVGIAASEDGFQHVSFVNSTRTKTGGTHILYIGMQIWERIREYIKKKHKIDVKPSELRQQITLFIDATISNPRYSSQTKDELITEAKDYKTYWDVTDKMVNRIVKLPVIESILDWARAKEQAILEAELRKKGKELNKIDPRRVEKFADATEKRDRHKCVLFLTEGDSAGKAIQSGRNGNPYIGSFPLKGKPLNVRDKELSRILGIKKKDDSKRKSEPSEIQKIMMVMGLEIGTKVTSLAQLRFGRIAFACDADVDGAHISGLLMNMFDHFWPELFDLGVINIFRTPLIKVNITGKNKQTLEFFTEREFQEWEKKEGSKYKWSKKWYKGLGTSLGSEFKEYFEKMETYLFTLKADDQEDKDAIDLAFNGQRADDRKDWLETPALNFDDFISEAL